MKLNHRLLQRSARLPVMALIAISGICSAGYAHTQPPEQKGNQTLESVSAAITSASLPPSEIAQSLRTATNQDSYILGPGDAVAIELLDVPEYSGVFTIGPDGTIYLPRLRSLLVEGLTVDELRSSLTRQYSVYVRNPQVFISPTAYRPIRVYIGGEVARPGFYYLSGRQAVGGAEAVGSPALSSNNLATGLTDFRRKATCHASRAGC